MRCFAVLRADSESKVKECLNDLEEERDIVIEGLVKLLPSEVADKVLVNVMETELEDACKAAGLVALKNESGHVIERVSEMHLPAHVVVVSERHSSFFKLKNMYNDLNDLERDKNKFLNLSI